MQQIDFTKPFYVEESRVGEQVITGIKLTPVKLPHNASYINISYANSYGSTERVPLAVSQVRKVGEYLINFANLNDSDFERLGTEQLKFGIPQDKFQLETVQVSETKLVSHSSELFVTMDQNGLELTQEPSDGQRGPQDVFLSRRQLESLIRQMVKHTPTFRKQLNTILEETI